MLRIKRDPEAKPPARKASKEIEAVRVDDVDTQFVALLRRKCTRAALTGALTAAIEAIPGLGRVLGFVFGEVLDAKFLARVQRELVEDTFKLYSLQLPAALHTELIDRVQTVGTSASIAGDILVRGVLRRLGGRIGGALTKRFVPIAAIVSSAVSNASVTYAIGKRAQAVAKWKDSPITGMPDVVRAFSGVDERRVLDWSLDAVKTSLGMIGDAVRKMARFGRKKSDEDSERKR
ncbi:MAG: hypothetical protein J0I77_21195 [Rudaea sp.]|uniref:hypothetical protein n=1 Tax=unclassified Rudaea TaxID=2627037 RepID=UPI0010F7D97F|nr:MULTISPECIES: hypothetical protein [unclassified Rudaea]MBN8888243.1 hypothetical protein [Rudaea sp.]MBR0344540.1 hypothetical protein [Rudaea sp.]